MHPPHHLPGSDQLLNCGGWWEPFAIEAAVVVGGVVDAFDAGSGL
ncbi:MAG: hypothetical protein ACLQU1_22990 [Bryobacteraceae bacterium]